MSCKRYRSFDHTIDLTARELWHDGALIRTSPMVFDCIAYLIEHRDRPVGRDELIAAVWGKTDVSYSLLGQLVAKVRRAMGGTGDDQRVVRTIPRFGYRWVAEAVEDTDTAEEPARTPTGIAIASARRLPATRQRIWLLSGLLLIMALSALWHHGIRQSVPAPTPVAETPDVVAILPIEVSAGGEWAWVRLGVMDLIAERLRDAGQPVVPSENIVGLARGGVLADIGDAVRDVTGADYVVETKAAHGDSEWSVRLVLRSKDGVLHIIETSDVDVTAAVRQAADRLLAQLGRPVPPAEDGSFARSAEDLLARARSALLGNDLEQARLLLESAPADMQRSPEVRLRLAQVDHRSGRLEAASRRLEELLDELADGSNPRWRAGAINDLGIIAIYFDQPLAAERRFAEALSVLAAHDDPSERGRAHSGLGIARALQGDYAAAGLQFSRARIAYGESGAAIALAITELNQAALEIRYNRYAAAKALLEPVVERFDRLRARHESFSAQTILMDVELTLLESAAALAIGARSIDRLDELQSPQARRLFRLEWARALAAVGRLAEASAVLDELARNTPHGQDSSAFLARVGLEQATLDFDAGRDKAALSRAKAAIDALTLPDYARKRARAWLVAVRALAALDHRDEAFVELERFSAWAREVNEPSLAMYATLAKAELVRRDGRREAAAGLYEDALRNALDHGVPADISELVHSYGNALLTENDLDRAGAVIGSVARFIERDFRSALLMARLHHALGRRQDWLAALTQARSLAGERVLPPEIVSPPGNNPPTGPD